MGKIHHKNVTQFQLQGSQRIVGGPRVKTPVLNDDQWVDWNWKIDTLLTVRDTDNRQKIGRKDCRLVHWPTPDNPHFSNMG